MGGSIPGARSYLAASAWLRDHRIPFDRWEFYQGCWDAMDAARSEEEKLLSEAERQRESRR